MPRPINILAAAILAEWGPNPLGRKAVRSYQIYSMPYVQAMLSLSRISDHYGLDDAEDIILRFLTNAGPWRGEVAKQVKAELNQHLKEKSCS
jgi:hypothetical protein